MKRNYSDLFVQRFLTGKDCLLQTVNRENPVGDDPPTGGETDPPPYPSEDEK